MSGKLEAPRDLPVGGQAVLEGVMMRGVSTWAVAVRKPTPEQIENGGLNATEGAKGEIEVVTEPLVSYAKAHRWARLPVLRRSPPTSSRTRSPARSPSPSAGRGS